MTGAGGRGARRRTPVAAAVLCLALVAGCGSGGDDHAGTAAASGGASHGAEDETKAEKEAEREGGADAGAPTDGPDGAPSGPSGAEGDPEAGGEEREYSEEEQRRLGEEVPEEEIVRPQDREFTAEEAEYLDGRVPRGADPGAILESGHEACDHVTILADEDRDRAVSALREGEPAAAAEAIPVLCPEHRDLLEAASD